MIFMKTRKTLALLFVPFLLLSCSGGSKEEKNYYFIDVDENEKVTANMIIKTHNEREIPVPFTYSDKYFDVVNDKLNVSLAKVSMGMAMLPSYPDDNLPSLSKYGFIDVEDGLTEAPLGSYDRTYYVLSHKIIKGRNMVSLAIRGSDYKEEWASNFNLGDSGDHAGFSYIANKLVDVLKAYITKYNLQDNPKLWITGYSRGGGIANLLGRLVSKDPFFMSDGSDNDLYVYTFEAPRGAIVDNDIYPFIINLVNRNDFIPYHFKYDFSILGKVHYVTDYGNTEDANAYYLANIEKDVSMPYYFPKKLNLTGQPAYISDDFDSSMTLDEFYEKFNKMIYMDTSDLPSREQYVDVSTRSKYMENISFSLSYGIRKVMTLSNKNIALISNYFSEHKSELYSIFQKVTGTPETVVSNWAVSFSETKYQRNKAASTQITAAVTFPIKDLTFFTFFSLMPAPPPFFCFSLSVRTCR